MEPKRRRFIPVYHALFDPTDKYYLHRVVLVGGLTGIGWAIAQFLMRDFDYAWLPGYGWLDYIGYVLSGLILLPGLIRAKKPSAKHVLLAIGGWVLFAFYWFIFFLMYMFPTRVEKVHTFSLDQQSYFLFEQERPKLFGTNYSQVVYERHPAVPFLLRPLKKGYGRADQVEISDYNLTVHYVDRNPFYFPALDKMKSHE